MSGGDRTFAEVGTLVPNTRAEQLAATDWAIRNARRHGDDPTEVLAMLFGPTRVQPGATGMGRALRGRANRRVREAGENAAPEPVRAARNDEQVPQVLRTTPDRERAAG